MESLRLTKILLIMLLITEMIITSICFYADDENLINRDYRAYKSGFKLEDTCIKDASR
jgi:hypothetical protein